jgi:alkylated DNA nucleotide flippase Atl1
MQSLETGKKNVPWNEVVWFRRAAEKRKMSTWRKRLEIVSEGLYISRVFEYQGGFF